MRKKKKLKSSDISKYSSVEVSHTIRRIKEHEKRYTTILVIFFLAIFLFIGYHLVSIDSFILSTNFKEFDDEIKGLSSRSELITLNQSSIMNDEDGLLSKPYYYHVSNRTMKDISYQLMFSLDDSIPFSLSSIKYSVNGGEVQSLKDNNEVIELQQIVKKREDVYYTIQFWIDENTSIDSNFKITGSIHLLERVE